VPRKEINRLYGRKGDQWSERRKKKARRKGNVYRPLNFEGYVVTKGGKNYPEGEGMIRLPEDKKKKSRIKKKKKLKKTRKVGLQLRLRKSWVFRERRKTR